MSEEIIIRYFHPVLKIGLQDIKTAWKISDPPFKLTTTIYRGCLIYRMPGSGKRISYRTLKKGLIKKKIIFRLPMELLPF